MLESLLDIRVEWGHCDPARIVYNPNFYDWMEHGLLALFEAADLDMARLVDAQPGFRGTPLVKAEAVFHLPAQVGDVLTLSSRVVRFGTSSFDVEHRFGRDGMRLVEGIQTRVWGVDAADDPDRLTTAPIPEPVRSALSAARVSHLRLRREEGPTG